MSKRKVRRSVKKKAVSKKSMKKKRFGTNVGRLDRVLRLLIAIVALPLGYYYSPWFYIITIIGLFSAVTGRCPLYKVLGITTEK